MVGAFRNFFHAVMFIFCLTTIIGNTITIIVILSKKSLRKNIGNLFILSLSLADFCVGLFVMIPAWMKSLVRK